MWVCGGDIDGGKILGEYPDDLTTDGPLIVNERGIGKSMILARNYFYLACFELLNIIIVYHSASNNTI